MNRLKKEPVKNVYIHQKKFEAATVSRYKVPLFLSLQIQNPNYKTCIWSFQ